MKTLQSDASGIVPIFKPIGPTSHDMIYRIRKVTGVKKVGHAGTLDPLAQGVLVVGIGRDATKKLSQEVKKEKEYKAEFTLGTTSTTDDAEGEKSIVNLKKQPSLGDIERVIQNEFTGEILQRPPHYSAVKLGGKKAYELARKGIVPELEPRIREVKSFTVLDYVYPVVTVRITTGSGVYIRSLARDIGDRLGTGAFMSSLIRTRVGDFPLADCYDVPHDD